MGESFFKKRYDVPEGMSPEEFDQKISDWEKRSAEKRLSLERFDAGKMFLDTKKIIQSISLKPEFSNKENQEELERRKKDAIKLLYDLIKEGGYIANYASYVNLYDKARANVSESERNEKEFYGVNEVRTRAHDALMSHMKATIRNIFREFSKMSDDELEDIEEQLESVNKKLLPIERMNFPGNEKIFLPPYVNFSNRKSISQWVEDIRRRISNIDIKEAFQ